MRWMWTCGLGLSLGCLAGQLGADEIGWRPAATPSRGSEVAPPTTGAPATGVNIGRPAPLVPSTPAPTAAPRRVESQLQRAFFAPPAFTPLAPIVRGQEGEDGKDKTDDGQDKKTGGDTPPGPEPLFPPRKVEGPPGEFGCERAPTDPSRHFRIVPATEEDIGCFDDPDGRRRPRAFLGRFYFSGEFMLWWLRGGAYPPLITTSPTTVPEIERGRLGPNTTVLFGNEPISQGTFTGGRYTLGFWMDPCKEWAIETTLFHTGERSHRFAVDSAAVPVLARPIQILNLNNIEGRQLFATPATLPGDMLDLRGGVVIDSPTRLWGIEANARRNLADNCKWRVDFLVGYRYLDLAEGLHIAEDVVTFRNIPGVPIFAGDRALVDDRFDTRNHFHGGQLGTTVERRFGRWSLESTFKIALGVNQQTVDVADGMTIIRPDGTSTRVVGGLLALPSNLGSHTRDNFAVVPEVGVKLGFQLLPRVKAYVGYDFLYISSVVRPGDQIDRTIDIGQIPFFANPSPPNTTGTIRPVVPFRTTDFWAHGVNFGLEFKY